MSAPDNLEWHHAEAKYNTPIDPNEPDGTSEEERQVLTVVQHPLWIHCNHKDVVTFWWAPLGRYAEATLFTRRLDKYKNLFLGKNHNSTGFENQNEFVHPNNWPRPPTGGHSHEYMIAVVSIRSPIGIKIQARESINSIVKSVISTDPIPLRQPQKDPTVKLSDLPKIRELVERREQLTSIVNSCDRVTNLIAIVAHGHRLDDGDTRTFPITTRQRDAILTANIDMINAELRSLGVVLDDLDGDGPDRADFNDATVVAAE